MHLLGPVGKTNSLHPDHNSTRRESVCEAPVDNKRNGWKFSLKNTGIQREEGEEVEREELFLATRKTCLSVYSQPLDGGDRSGGDEEKQKRRRGRCSTPPPPRRTTTHHDYCYTTSASGVTRPSAVSIALPGARGGQLTLTLLF
ncbi:hypothetical protein Pmani_009001 [Petrolisthes manimaculis]|uniref:Uncharacterized protein n=1 Tax=Petrolisthes manimaculis TaxID=1843537 RepID=A0AAE1Q5B0_9EUCA|nr:hypothetical protein Pmani_009001 [Petrolisthes manimaculis]